MKRPTIQWEDDIETEAATWLARCDAGLSLGEEAELERWKTSDRRHAAALAEFETIWTEVGRPRRTGIATAVRQEYGVLRRRRHRRRASIAAAAVAVILSTGVFVSPWFPGESAAPAARAIVLLSERRELPDGSVVELKEGARIAVNFESGASGSRHVTLQTGEAYFQVVKDARRPFIVTVGEVKVRAVGTAFSVQHGTAHMEVFVTEGTVAVERGEGIRLPRAGNREHADGSPALTPALPPSVTPTLVEAGNRILVEIAANEARPRVLPVAATEISQRLAWRSPRVEFSRASLPEVVAVVNRHGRVQSQIADPELERMTLSGLFRTDDADALAHALEHVFGLRADRVSEGEIVLRRAHDTDRLSSEALK